MGLEDNTVVPLSRRPLTRRKGSAGKALDDIDRVKGKYIATCLASRLLLVRTCFVLSAKWQPYTTSDIDVNSIVQHGTALFRDGAEIEIEPNISLSFRIPHILLASFPPIGGPMILVYPVNG